MEALQAGQVPAGEMLRVAEMPSAEYYETRALYTMSEHPEIENGFFVERGFAPSHNLPLLPQSPAPLLGEHSRQIVERLLGLPPGEVSRLIETKVLETSEEDAAIAV